MRALMLSVVVSPVARLNAELGKVLDTAEQAKWAKVVKESGAKFD